jgi:hypothetical protein
MARDSTLAVRRGILTLLKANAEVIAIVPAAQVYTQVIENPGWPFIRYGAPSALPIRATCLDGVEISVAIHGFARSRKQGGAVVETAEDHAARLGAAIARALDGRRIDLPDGYGRLTWQGGQLLVDGAEATAFHTVQNLRVRCVTGSA